MLYPWTAWIPDTIAQEEGIVSNIFVNALNDIKGKVDYLQPLEFFIQIAKILGPKYHDALRGAQERAQQTRAY